MHDYLQEIQRNQAAFLKDEHKAEVQKICQSLQNIIGDSRNAQVEKDQAHVADDAKESELEQKVTKFFEWAQTYTSSSDEALMNDEKWRQLRELFNFQHPQYAIALDVDLMPHRDGFFFRHCKEKGNALMKAKKIRSAIRMYSKAIEVLEREEKEDRASLNELAIVFCNRSAAWVYLKEYQKAVDDAVSALRHDPLLTKAWIRKGMAEQELKRFKIAYGDYQVALNQSKRSDNYFKFLDKKTKQCFGELLNLQKTTESEENAQL